MIAISLSSSVAFADSGEYRAVEVSLDKVFLVSVEKGGRMKSVTCAENDSGRLVPGSIRSKKGVFLFTPLSKKLRRLKRLSRASTQKALLLKKERKFQKLAMFECSRAVDDSAPDPVEDPVKSSPKAASPTPTATPVNDTPLPENAMYDSRGNVTENGKMYLGIPDYLEANISAGELVQLTHCEGCHGERTSWDYLSLLDRIPLAPMFFQIPTQITEQELADLTAYLNRGRLTTN